MSSLSSPSSAVSESPAPLPIVVATYDQAIGRMIVMALRLAGYAPQLYPNGEQSLEAMHWDVRSGRLNQKVDPCPGVLSTPMVPPWAVTISWLM